MLYLCVAACLPKAWCRCTGLMVGRALPADSEWIDRLCHVVPEEYIAMAGWEAHGGINRCMMMGAYDNTASRGGLR